MWSYRTRTSKWVEENVPANIRIFPSSMVEVSYIDKKNGSKSIYIENNIINTILYNWFGLKKYPATGIILGGNCLRVIVLGGNCPGDNFAGSNCPVTSTKCCYNVKHSTYLFTWRRIYTTTKIDKIIRFVFSNFNYKLIRGINVSKNKEKKIIKKLKVLVSAWIIDETPRTKALKNKT